ncbi:hypothetical protein VTH06DRAFT_7950 [Thermothelomyces fergusii]
MEKETEKIAYISESDQTDGEVMAKSSKADEKTTATASNGIAGATRPHVAGAAAKTDGGEAGAAESAASGGGSGVRDAAVADAAAGPTADTVPDGGLVAWLQVAYYETELLADRSSSDISWIGSTQSALLFVVGVFAGPLYDAGYFRHLLIAGLSLIVLGQFMTSLCTAYWQVMLAQGVAMGIGMGMTFLPSAAILSQYFLRHRALALGLSSVGSPVAGGVFAFLTLYVTFFYITLFATSRRVASDRFAPYLVTLLNAGSIPGRIIPNALADRYGSMNLMIACSSACAVLAFGWLGIRDLGGAVAYALLYGVFSGGVVSLMPSVIVGLSPDMGRVGARMGMGFLVMGIAILVGTPIAGAILGSEENPEWLGTRLYSAFGLLVATALFCTSRILVFRRKGGCRA